MEPMTALDYVEMAHALEVLAFHDKNYLAHSFATSNRNRSAEMLRLLRSAANELRKVTKDRSPMA